MKKNKSFYIVVVLLLVCANCCFAQKKLASNKPMQSFYSAQTKAYLSRKKPAPVGAATAKPVLASQKSSREMMIISKKNSTRPMAHPNSNLTPEQKQRLLPSNTITMDQFSKQSLNKRNKAAHQL